MQVGEVDVGRVAARIEVQRSPKGCERRGIASDAGEGDPEIACVARVPSVEGDRNGEKLDRKPVAVRTARDDPGEVDGAGIAVVHEDDQVDELVGFVESILRVPESRIGVERGRERSATASQLVRRESVREEALQQGAGFVKPVGLDERGREGDPVARSVRVGPKCGDEVRYHAAGSERMRECPAREQVAAPRSAPFVRTQTSRAACDTHHPHPRPTPAGSPGGRCSTAH